MAEGDGAQRQKFLEINRVMDVLEINAEAGQQVPKRIIPKDYIKKYSINNLWKYNLSDGWRLTYTILNEEIVVISLLIEWMDHNEYEKRFGY